MVGDGVGSTTGAGDSDGIACSSASAIASSPAAFGCSGAGSSGPCTYGSDVHSSCPANCAAATPNPNDYVLVRQVYGDGQRFLRPVDGAAWVAARQALLADPTAQVEVT